MKWILATTYPRNEDDPNDLWNIIQKKLPKLKLTYIAPTYDHERSRANAGWRDWIDYWQQSGEVWQHAKQNGCDVIITTFPQLAACIGLRKRFSGSKITVVAWTFNLGKLYSGLKAEVARFALAKIDKFIVPSTAEITTYSRFLNQPANKFGFIHYRKQLIEPWENKSIDSPFIVSMGSANRDYETLIKAAALSNLPVIIVGPGRLTDSINIPANVVIKSNLSLKECHTLVQQAVFSVVPLRNPDIASGQITIIESMIFKTPVIATDSIGTADYITDGTNGLLARGADVNDLADKMQTLWDDSELRNKLVENGYIFVKEYLSGDKVASDMIELLKAISNYK